MHKKILLLLLALSSIFTSHQNISSLDDEYKKLDLYNKYKKNRFKKAPFMSLKLKNVFCDYKNIKGGLWKKAEDLLRMIESLEKYIQSGRMHPYDILSFSSPSLRKRDNSWTGFTKNNVSLNKIPSKLFRNKEYFLVTFILWRKNLFNN